MRILFLTQWFEPEPAFKGIEFAAGLKASGHEVEVATAFPNYPGGKLYPGYSVRPYRHETMGDISIHRLAIWPSHNRSSIGRVANYLSFFLSALVFGLLRGRRYDLVYVYHPPVTPAAAAAIFCRLHRKPLVLEIQDLWPDSVGASGMADGRVTRILDHVCNFVYRSAARIIPQSDKMLDRLRDRGVPPTKLHRIYNWATYRPASEADDDLPADLAAAFLDRFNIVYGGNLGQAQALHSLIDGAVLAAAKFPRIHLHLFGGGIESASLQAHAERVGAGKVTLHGGVGRTLMDRVFDKADLLAVQLKDDPLYALTIPSKVQHYLACGVPIVAGLTGEAAELLRASGAALVCPPQDVVALAAAIKSVAVMHPIERRSLGQNGRSYYENNFGFERAIDETVRVIVKTEADFKASMTENSK